MTEMTEHERRVYDARAREKAWGYAAQFAALFREMAEHIGSEELLEVITDAEDRCDQGINAALDERAALTGEEL